MSAFFSLNKADIWKGLIVAGLAAFLGALQQALTGNGLDVAAYDWGGILNVVILAAGSYLSKNLLSNTEGSFAGVGPASK